MSSFGPDEYQIELNTREDIMLSENHVQVGTEVNSHAGPHWPIIEVEPDIQFQGSSVLDHLCMKSLES